MTLVPVVTPRRGVCGAARLGRQRAVLLLRSWRMGCVPIVSPMRLITTWPSTTPTCTLRRAKLLPALYEAPAKLTAPLGAHEPGHRRSGVA